MVHDNGPPEARPAGDTRPGFRHDAPLPARGDDRLRRRPFAHRLAQALATSPGQEGLVVGLYGAWGEGKTTLLQMVEDALPKPPAVVVLWFNPWFFRGDEQLVAAFFGELAAKLQQQLTTRGERAAKAVQRYAGALADLPTDALGIPNPAKAVAAMAGQVQQPGLEELRRRVEAMLAEAGARVVVFVDDIDRLDRAEAQAVFKLVKLTGGFRGITYVLAFDDQMVAAALGERYAGGGTEAGRQFLEKIVQVPLRLPPAHPDTLLQMTLEGIDTALAGAGVESPERDTREFRLAFDPMFRAARRSIRAAKRYHNALVFGLPLVAGEVHVGDFLLLEALRVYYPDLHSALLPNRDLLLKGHEQRGRGGDREDNPTVRRWDALLARVPEPEREVVVDVLAQLFPRSTSFARNTGYSDDWDEKWAKGRRATAGEYFDRYFRYVIGDDDVSDFAVGALRQALARGDANDTAGQFAALATPAAAARLIRKVRRIEGDLTETEAHTLVGALAAHGGGLPHLDDGFGFGTPFTQAAILAVRALRRVAPGDRDQLAAALVGSPSLSFAVECWHWLEVHARPQDDEDDSEDQSEASGEPDGIGARTASPDHLPDETLAALGSTLGMRLTAAARETPLYLRPHQEARVLLSRWLAAAGDDVVRPVLRAQLEATPTDAGRLLAALGGAAWSLETGERLEREFDRRTYNFLIRLVDPADMVRYLERTYGTAFTAPDAEIDADAPTADHLARRFLDIDWSVRRSRGASDGDDPAAE